jgi:hypothetical protein
VWTESVTGSNFRCLLVHASVAGYAGCKFPRASRLYWRRGGEALDVGDESLRQFSGAGDVGEKEMPASSARTLNESAGSPLGGREPAVKSSLRSGMNRRTSDYRAN